MGKRKRGVRGDHCAGCLAVRCLQWAAGGMAREKEDRHRALKGKLGVRETGGGLRKVTGALRCSRSGQEGTGSWAGLSRLVRLECAALEGASREPEPGPGRGLWKVLRARLALRLHPGQPGCLRTPHPASAFSRRADAAAPASAFPRLPGQPLLTAVPEPSAPECLGRAGPGLG